MAFVPSVPKEKKTRKSPVPASAERIKEGALKLSLKDRVDLKNELAKSIDKELEEMEAILKDSRNIANGMK